METDYWQESGQMVCVPENATDDVLSCKINNKT